jgi:uncharacterized cupredoxin-like copper-binding protein
MPSIRFIVAVLALAISGSAPAFAGPGAADHAHGGFAGEPGDWRKPSRVIEVRMRETNQGKMVFSPNRLTVKQGEQIKFVIRNDGEVDHEFVVATLRDNLKHAEEMQKNPDMEHDDPNALRLLPKQKGEIFWRFTNKGKFDFSCLIPGHRESGMFGTVIVN